MYFKQFESNGADYRRLLLLKENSTAAFTGLRPISSTG